MVEEVVEEDVKEVEDGIGVGVDDGGDDEEDKEEDIKGGNQESSWRIGEQEVVKGDCKGVVVWVAGRL